MKQSPVFSLLSWYASVRRPLPWRQDRDPYHVAVSEIMLQQTRIATVIPKYEAFMAAFPNWEALADADEASVLKVWEGLGYYARARNLQKAARIVVDRYGGKMPSSAKEIASLPGFGPYTSASIAAFCFGKKEVAVDGNLCRVYARLETVALSASSPTLKKQADAFFRRWLEEGDPGLINEGLMELGETICLPAGEPLCITCPLSAYCQAHAKHNEQAFPLPKEKPNRSEETFAVLLLEHGGQYALEQRPPHGLLASLYAFPTIPGKHDEKNLTKLLSNQSMAIASLRCIGHDDFLFTHKTWHLDYYHVALKERPQNYVFYDKEAIEKDLSVPTAFRFGKDFIAG